LLAGYEGCRKHPSYRFVRKPTADCGTCRVLYTNRKRLNDMDIAVRSGKRGKASKPGLSDQDMAELLVLTT